MKVVEYIVISRNFHIKYFGSDEEFKEFLDRTDIEKEVYRIKIFEQSGSNVSKIVFYNEFDDKINH